MNPTLAPSIVTTFTPILVADADSYIMTLAQNSHSQLRYLDGTLSVMHDKSIQNTNGELPFFLARLYTPFDPWTPSDIFTLVILSIL